MIRKPLLLLLLSMLWVGKIRADIGVEIGGYGECLIVKKPYCNPECKYHGFGVGGLAIYFQAGRFVTLNYSAGFGKFNGYSCIRSSLQGISAGAMTQGDTPAWFLLLIIPDGIGVYTNPEHKGLHFSVDFLASDYYYLGRPTQQVDWVYTPAVVTRYRFRVPESNIAIVPYVSLEVNMDALACAFGAQITFENIRRKKEETRAN